LFIYQRINFYINPAFFSIPPPTIKYTHTIFYRINAVFIERSGRS
jgi:hypothetical protein